MKHVMMPVALLCILVGCDRVDNRDTIRKIPTAHCIDACIHRLHGHHSASSLVGASAIAVNQTVSLREIRTYCAQYIGTKDCCSSWGGSVRLCELYSPRIYRVITDDEIKNSLQPPRP